MPLLSENENGKIYVSEETIAKAAGIAALECYGIVGMVSKKKIKDGVFELLGKDTASKGIIVLVDAEKNQVEIDINIIVSYGVKISEVGKSIQEKVMYDLNQMLGLKIEAVNIYVQGVQLIKDEK